MSHGSSSVNKVTHCRQEHGIGDVGAPEHPLGTEGVKTALQVRMQAAERVVVLRIACLPRRLDRDVRVFGERQQLRLEPIGGLAFAARRYRHVVDNQFDARVALGDLAKIGRQGRQP